MSFGKFIKQNFALCVGLGLPILLVVSFLCVSIIPKTLAAPPQHKLVYATEQYNGGKNRSFVTSVETGNNGHIYLRLTKTENASYGQTQRIFIFDPATGKNEEISFAYPDAIRGQSEEIPLPEAAHLKLSKDIKAPDGFIFEETSYHSSGLILDLFGGGRSASPRIVKDSVAYKLPDNGRYAPVRFLGWVIEEKKKS